uniref:Conserved domain protein n=1 Tax=Steinernema glaseri TaxID=37863 RepID=A0A1I8A9R9_9BILA
MRGERVGNGRQAVASDVSLAEPHVVRSRPNALSAEGNVNKFEVNENRISIAEDDRKHFEMPGGENIVPKRKD